MNDLLELASLGFIGGYLAVCVAAPIYLAKRAELRWFDVTVMPVTVLVLGTALFLTVFPVPEGAEKYLPYIFIALLIIGMIASRLCQGKGAEAAKEVVKPAV